MTRSPAFENITIVGTIAEMPSPMDVRDEGESIGVVLPPTYVEWCTKFGRGVLDDLIEIWVPVRSVP